MHKTKKVFLVLFVIIIPATLYLGTKLKGRWYYLTSTMMVIETMIPFFLSFEVRKPQARELVTIAVMCALSVASRVVIVIPNFKPMMAIIMITHEPAIAACADKTYHILDGFLRMPDADSPQEV